ncbi:MAG TPA: class I SAM-dependent methyltransferase [Gaiellaceae bacterium]|nr:class I SAM-dependent methyltransferase [Gaiellaceae bacterium]
MPTALYDGVAGFYEEQFAPGEDRLEVVQRLVGPGPGAALDLGCGTGFYLPLLHALGWTPTGVDLSADQLEFAQQRAGDIAVLIHADATDLPFPDESFDLVFSAFTHTDIDAFAAAVSEASRVLRPGARFVYLGLHPCFVGPHTRFANGLGVPALQTGYAKSRRYTDAPGLNPDGLRIKVGAVHLPLGGLLGAFLEAGLRIDAFEEPISAGREYPHWLALRATR